MSSRPLAAIILAAGEGTRMRSSLPKPLHLLSGRPMVRHVLGALDQCALDRVIVVVGHGADQVRGTLIEAADHPSLEFVEQTVQRGTGDAVSVALGAFSAAQLDDPTADVLVLPGDAPLLRATTLAELLRVHRAAGAACTLLTAVMSDPTGYGRVVRGDDGSVVAIVEQADATEAQRAITEVNTSIYCFRVDRLAMALEQLTPQNAQGEYYLTDVVGLLAGAGDQVSAVVAPDAAETSGVNDRVQLAAAEAELRRRINAHLMRQGVTMIDPDRTYIESTVSVAADVTILPGTLLQGRCVIGAGAVLGPDTHLVDTSVGVNSIVEQTVARDAVIGADTVVGPFAVLEAGAVVPDGTVSGALYTPPGRLD